MIAHRHRNNERGGILLIVVVFIAAAIAALAGISSSRVVYATRNQRVMEEETRAFSSAYAQIHMAMNVVNNSAYDEQNHNLVLQNAVADVPVGGGQSTAGGPGKGNAKKGTTTTTTTVVNPDPATGDKLGGEETGYAYDDASNWIDHPDDPGYGLVPATNVRVYRARDYIQRLQRLKGEAMIDVDPGGLSESYYVLEAAGRVGHTVRLISALVRENEPFSSFVFFQNRATLGVSGSPRGLTHSNEKIAFYFPGGSYVDSVSAVAGFEYMAGATPENTGLRNANPGAKRIDLEKVNFADLKSKSTLFVGQSGLDAEVKLYSNSKVRVKEYTPPRYDMVTKSYTYNQWVGSHTETYLATEQVKVGETQVPYQAQVVDYYQTETYWVTEQVKVGEKTETRYKNVKVQVGTRDVVKTKQEPIYEQQTVTKTRRVKVWQPYSQGDAGGGTAVGGGGAGALGEWVWVDEPYETTEMVQVGTRTVEYTVTEPVYETQKQAYTVQVPIYETQQVQKQRQVPVYKTVTQYRTEPIYETQQVEKTRTVNDYEPVTVTWQEEEYFGPVYQGMTWLTLSEDAGGTMYIDGRITGLDGQLRGRLTIVGNEKIRVTGNIQYVDGKNNTAMENGTDYTQSYQRNPRYEGRSVLGIIARDDIVYTRTMPSNAEVNGTMMSVNGRVGIDGFWADATGELVKDSRKNRQKYLTAEQYDKERAYDRRGSTRTRTFTANSLRRIGGIISNNRIMETYVTTGKDGTSKVSAGFKRGNMKFDINMLFNPPPNFVEVPRPVLTYFSPILLVRNHDS